MYFVLEWIAKVKEFNHRFLLLCCRWQEKKTLILYKMSGNNLKRDIANTVNFKENINFYWKMTSILVNIELFPHKIYILKLSV